MCARPTLTIDFTGLSGFVANDENPENATQLHALLMDTTEEADNGDLCRHDPYVVFDLQNDFLNASSLDFHHSVTTSGGDDLGFWNVKGKDLVVDGFEEGTLRALEIKDSYDRVLTLAALNGSDGSVKPEIVAREPCPGIATRLPIEHGKVSAHRWSNRWGLARVDGAPAPNDYFRFRQVVRWRIYGAVGAQSLGLALSASEDEWVQFQKGAHIVISNLCPFAPADAGPAKDVLAFYRLCENPVDEEDRLVLHPRDEETGTAGIPVRPGVDACPPVTGYLR